MSSRWSALVAVLLVGALTGGCSGSGSGRSAPKPSTRPTPLAKMALGKVRIARATFCDQVSSTEVRRALRAKPDANQRWGNGDPVPTTTGSGSGPGDVGHELGCGWSTTAGDAARAWVFARPVAADLAGTLVQQAGRAPGCTLAKDPRFGNPALLQTCTEPGGTVRVRRAGLFGDTWLTCELSGPAVAQPRARLDDWCAAVVTALDVG